MTPLALGGISRVVDLRDRSAGEEPDRERMKFVGAAVRDARAHPAAHVQAPLTTTAS
jgi:hypothetical protein